MNKFMMAVKSPKVLIAGAVLLAFAVGAIFEGYTKFGTTSASSTPTEAIAASANPSAAANPNAAANSAAESPAEPGAETAAAATAAPTATTTTSSTSGSTSGAPRPVHHKRSLEKEALIVGGSAAGGAAIGGIAGGGKGAGIGALSGGAAGLIYDLATKNK
jgi:hypothetical protein